MFNEIQRPLILLNPGSGSVRDGDDLRAKLEQRVPNARVVTSEKPGDVEIAAAKAHEHGYNAVIAAGGDGTLNEALNGIMRASKSLQLGLIPLGTGNDFARVMGLSTDVDEALEMICRGATRKLDVIRVNGAGMAPRYMINVAAGGFAGLVSENVTAEIKASWGPLSYLRGMLDALGEMQTYEARFQADEGSAEILSTLNVVIANGSHVARGIPIAPTADPADGLMDVVAIRDISLPALALLAPQILAATHLDNAEILHFRARKLSIQSNPPMVFNADGELIGDHVRHFEVIPQAVSFIAPARAE